MKLIKKSITKEQFLNATIKDISQVYSGKRDCCRCGCGGDYTATSYMKDVRSDIDNELVEKRLKRAKRLVKEGADCFVGDTFFDVQTGKNRTLTFYFDELK
jgi:hypothetical protein